MIRLLKAFFKMQRDKNWLYLHNEKYSIIVSKVTVYAINHNSSACVWIVIGKQILSLQACLKYFVNIAIWWER